MIPRIIIGSFFVACATLVVFGQSPSPQLSPSPIETPSRTPTSTPDDRPLRDALKTMAENSRNDMSWALTLVGASILAIVSTGYLRPISRRMRLVYLLFIPGWLLLGVSLYYGDSIARRYIAATFAPNRERLSKIGQLMNSEFASQLSFMNLGLGVFAVWLIVYIIWWVSTDFPNAKEKPNLFPKRRRRLL